MIRRNFLSAISSFVLFGGICKMAKYDVENVVVLTCDVPTKTNRIYSRELVERSILNCDELGVIGGRFDCITHLKDVSHRVLNLRLDGNDLVCDIKFLDTPNGIILKNTPKEDVIYRPAGIRYGRVDENGINVIDESYIMIAIDAHFAKE